MSTEPIISQEEMAGLLGRPLDEVEQANYDLYLEIALLRLDDLLCIKIEEMSPIPADLKLVIARCFAVIKEEQGFSARRGIDKKQIEDFSISYQSDTADPMVAFVQQNGKIIDKYGNCQGRLRSGKVEYGDCIQCI